MTWISASMSVVAACAATTFAQNPTFGPHYIRLQPVASGLTAPVQAKSPPDGSNRLFIADQNGKIRILQDGVLLATPFLDVAPLMVTLNPGYDERGLLGMAFHPDFASNGRFFIHYTAPRTGVAGVDPCFGTTRGCSSEVIAEYRVSTSDSNVADPASGVVLLSVPKPQFNHAGGGLDFGPDGYLYIGLGDGGGAHDGLADVPPSHGPIGNAQNLEVPLGKILRYDVSVPGVLNIPASNPFAGQQGRFEGIYSYGHRNPYSMCFDDAPGGTGELYVADVGQNLYEEINIVTGGNNYGWPLMEGFHCFDPFAPNTPPASCPAADSMARPIAEYPHADGATPIGIAVVCGYVYRGLENPSLNGLFLFGDYSTSFGAARGQLFYLDPATRPSEVKRLRIERDSRPLNLFLKGMGRDAAGEVYVLATSVGGPTGTTGVVLRVESLCLSDFNNDGGVDSDDVIAFFASWDAGQTAADMNGDGGVDADDVIEFFGRWDQGC